MTTQDDLLLAIGRLEGKVDSILATMRVHQDQLDKLDRRVRSLEGGRAWAMGMAAAVSVITTFGIKLFSI
jgi:hypothetical protein